MSQPSPDARHVARAVDALTTQVRRIADAVSTPAAALGDAPTTTADDGPTRRLHHWFPISQQQAEEMNESASLIQQWAAGAYVQARAAEEDAQRTARRTSLRVILDRASRGVILRTDEAALLRQHVEAEQRDADTARRNAELADAVTAETKRLKERRTTTLRERAERAEAAIKRVRALLAGRWGAVDPDLVRAALDGTDQPTTEA
ncbi:hypothetical protein [Streptomyces sp. NPDC057115]|uniref:hypothetical protein n=1 Tax=Streptomyces sp. NPDC057115 TaxID=3346022 RepID=UPI00363B856E